MVDQLPYQNLTGSVHTQDNKFEVLNIIQGQITHALQHFPALLERSPLLNSGSDTSYIHVPCKVNFPMFLLLLLLCFFPRRYFNNRVTVGVGTTQKPQFLNGPKWLAYVLFSSRSRVDVMLHSDSPMCSVHVQYAGSQITCKVKNVFH